jgi:hypothetical protein
VELNAEFLDEDAATRFEDKIRKLLEDDNMHVVFAQPGPKTPEDEPQVEKDRGD